MREPLLYRVVRPIIRVLFNFIYRPTYIGISNIPNDGKVVLAGNHTSYLDCLLLISSTKRVIHFLAKDDLVKGIKGVIFRGMGIIPVNRKVHDKGALDSAISVLNDNKVIGIFPESTINKTKDIVMPFKIGAVKMANVTDSKIVPFVIIGKYKIFRKCVKIYFLDELSVGNDLDSENSNLMNIISDMIRKESN